MDLGTRTQVAWRQAILKYQLLAAGLHTHGTVPCRQAKYPADKKSLIMSYWQLAYVPKVKPRSPGNETSWIKMSWQLTLVPKVVPKYLGNEKSWIKGSWQLT